jgi:hypothetical protein
MLKSANTVSGVVFEKVNWTRRGKRTAEFARVVVQQKTGQVSKKLSEQ